MTDIAENRSKPTTYLYALFGICFLGGVFGGITATLMSSYLPDVVKALIGNTDQEKMEQVSAVINAVFLFGMTLGGLSLGDFCDHFGRKKSRVGIPCFYWFIYLADIVQPKLVIGCCFSFFYRFWCWRDFGYDRHTHR